MILIMEAKLNQIQDLILSLRAAKDPSEKPSLEEFENSVDGETKKEKENRKRDETAKLTIKNPSIQDDSITW